jgi:thiamine pyrophosphokinase
MNRTDDLWDVNLASLAAYKVARGHCNVTLKDDAELGRWVKRQRYNKQKFDAGENFKGMTAKRVAQLDALGFVWGKNDKWDAMLARLEDYKAVYGDYNVPDRWAEDDGKLYRWVKKQRNLKQKYDAGENSEGMTAERVAQMNALGFVWGESKTDQWDAKLARLAAYKEAKDHCNVQIVEDDELGNWVKRQRNIKRNYDKGENFQGMTAERVAQLDALGFVWEKNDKWDAMLARLEDYKAVYGDYNVPDRWAEDPGLGRWVTQQRSNKRKLDRNEYSEGMTSERVARMSALGFVWNPRRGRCGAGKNVYDGPFDKMEEACGGSVDGMELECGEKQEMLWMDENDEVFDPISVNQYRPDLNIPSSISLEDPNLRFGMDLEQDPDFEISRGFEDFEDFDKVEDFVDFNFEDVNTDLTGCDMHTGGGVDKKRKSKIKKRKSKRKSKIKKRKSKIKKRKSKRTSK